eukprot:TRINITY_DN17104_c0_g1_i13.p2 TRINITY_DN17104_c0_g1~~TRINITY_DN17104_c0_g1_i13.p2  ORF type:complete len:140 (+),score=30.27 TRINITY_DN17104_c0_g1_i13:2168-2587(+)
MRRALPLCVTLSKSEDRLAALLELPYEEAIHLCLVGDYAACPGDEAFELCRCLTGAPTFRKHVAVVRGGWSSIQELADSLGLELFSVEADADSDLLDVGLQAATKTMNLLWHGAGRALSAFGSLRLDEDPPATHDFQDV